MRKLRRFGGRTGRRATTTSVVVEDPAALLTDPDELRQTIAKQFANPEYKPPTLPDVATRLLAMEGEQNVGIDRIVGLLEQDALLTGRILQLVRSPLYAGRMPIRTLHAAVVRMGLRTVRNTVMEVALASRIMKARPPLDHAMQQLALHSRVSAHVARFLARGTEIDPELAFLAGLLHDLGSAAALLTLSELLPPTMKIKSFPVVWSSIDALHERTSRKICDLWKLPQPIAHCVGFHHRPEEDPKSEALTSMVCVAENVACRSGAPATLLIDDGGSPRFDSTPPATVQIACDRLGIDAEKIERALAEGERIRDAVRAEGQSRAA